MVVVGVLTVFALRGRHHAVPLAMFCVANVVAGIGNVMTGDEWFSAGNFMVAIYFAGLWWRDRSGDPPWLRDALAAAHARDQPGTPAPSPDEEAALPPWAAKRLRPLTSLRSRRRGRCAAGRSVLSAAGPRAQGWAADLPS